MFERMTDAMRRVIVSAQAEVASMRHAEIDDDHLLLALTMGNDPAAELVAGRVAAAALHRHVAVATVPWLPPADPRPHADADGG